MSKQLDWAIIGGGMLGMTLALRLVQQGHKVTIYESSDKAGGLTSAWRMDDIVWDRFYHVILMSDINTRKILKEIGNTISFILTHCASFSKTLKDPPIKSESNCVSFPLA